MEDFFPALIIIIGIVGSIVSSASKEKKRKADEERRRAAADGAVQIVALLHAECQLGFVERQLGGGGHDGKDAGVGQVAAGAGDGRGAACVRGDQTVFIYGSDVGTVGRKG